jgi:hypothetical protein
MGRRLDDFSDKELVEKLNVDYSNPGTSVVFTEAVVHAELLRRNTAALASSGKRMERLTWALVVFTIVLVVFAAIQAAD